MSILDATVYMESTTVQTINLPEVANGSCEFSNALLVESGLTILEEGIVLDLSHLQPVFQSTNNPTS